MRMSILLLLCVMLTSLIAAETFDVPVNCSILCKDGVCKFSCFSIPLTQWEIQHFSIACTSVEFSITLKLLQLGYSIQGLRIKSLSLRQHPNPSIIATFTYSF